MKTNKNYFSSQFVCTECGEINFPIQRPKFNKREKDHIKDLYCYHCRKVTKNKEVDQFSLKYSK